MSKKPTMAERLRLLDESCPTALHDETYSTPEWDYYCQNCQVWRRAIGGKEPIVCLQCRSTNIIVEAI